MKRSASASDARARSATSAPDQHERGAGREVPLGGIRSERVHARGLAGLGGGADRVQHRVDDLGVVLLPEQAHRGGEVGRADEDPVDAVDRRDLGDPLDGRRRLDLHEQR